MPPAVQRARAVKELFENDVAGLRAYEALDEPYALRFQLKCSATELKEDELQACLDLVEETSGHHYRASSINWNPRKKREEMKDKDMIFLLVRQCGVEPFSRADTRDTDKACPVAKPSSRQETSNTKKTTRRAPPTQVQQQAQLDDLEQLAQGYAFDDETPTPSTTNSSTPHPDHHGPILGFISFMFTWDDPPHDDREVVYIYEIHLSAQLRGQGLGTRLMSFVEHVARQCHISKTMLTVFTANEGAKAMYEKVGYEKDECSPGDRVMRNKVVKAEYLIMSKKIL
ncbi:acyl-CoA N-acyltransferase [Curvularia clavata]|uniref:N-alpha-acetyltransferase 40 n=1 Tax=Curvularia clavata TaxID=95742 RepID=A0A9Q9DVC2_CURCL|nr:acyl-CoA N-acyltransferase [Curvularia clavata]